MASSYTPLLGFVLPVTGELSGSWGTVWNDSGTSLLDSAISGTTTLSTDADVTLTTTTGAANQARQAIILWNPASGTVTRNITVPAQSKIYTVINASGGTQSIVLRGVGPTTGVTIIKGESAVVAWNGTDFIKISNTGGGGSFTSVTISGTTTLSGLTASTALALDASKNVVSVTNTGTGNNVLSASPTLVTPALGTPTSVTLTNATGLPISTGVSGLGTGVATALAVNVGTAGAPVLFNGALGTPSSGTVTNLTGTASININGTVGATTPATGAFTTLTTSSTVTINGGTANGVAFLNASKVLTTGSALTFDGTTLSSTQVQGTTALVAQGGTSDRLAIQGLATGSGSLLTSTNAAANAYAPLTLDGSNTRFNVSGSEQMRLTSTGLGIGTSSPSAKLDVYGSSTTAEIRIRSVTSLPALSFWSESTAAATRNWAIASSYDAFGDFVIRQSTALGGNPLTAGVNRLVIDASGNLGIGTSSPNFKVQATGSIAASDATFVGPNTLIGAILSNDSAGSGAAPGLDMRRWTGSATTHGTGRIGTDSTAAMLFYTDTKSTNTFATTERMRIDSSGNVGIGTSLPAVKLETSSTSAGATVEVLRLSNPGAGGNTQAQLKFFTASTNYGTISGGYGASVPQMTFDLPNGTPGNYVWQISSSEKMRLDSSGNLGLGVTPSAWGGGRKSLDVSNASFYSQTGNYNGVASNAYNNGSNWIYKTTAAAQLYEQGGGTHAWLTAPSGTAGNAISFSQVMSLTAAGEFLLGMTSVSTTVPGTLIAKLSANVGAIRNVKTATGTYESLQNYHNGSYVGGITYSDTATALVTSSDYRLKNITGRITASGAYIDSLNPVEGTWKADGSTFVGLIAHEVQEASRTPVATGVKDGEETQAMDYSSPEIIANIIAELQSLRKRVAELEAK